MASSTATRPPLYASAVVILQQLATPLFNRAMAAPEGTRAREQAENMSLVLQATAAHIAHTRSLDLWQGTLAAFVLVHDLAHDCDINGASSLIGCRCETAHRIADFYELVEQWKAEAANVRAA